MAAGNNGSGNGNGAAHGGRGRIRVAHLITRLELGGAQLNTLYTCAHLDPDRFDVHLICGAGGLLDAEADRIGKVRVHTIPALVRPIRPWRDAAALVGLVRCLKRIRPDLVHTHSSKAGILGRWAARLAGVPVTVHTFHGFGFHDQQPWWLRRLLIQAERLAARATTRFLAVSRRTLRIGAGERVLDPDRAEVLFSGVALGRRGDRAAARQRLLASIGATDTAAEPLLVGMVGCLKPQKAPVDFVRLAARVLPEFPAAHFVLIGDGVLRAAVENRIHRVGVAGRVHLLGWRRDVRELLPGFDLLVQTSRWEGLPRVFAEGRDAGLPIVATRVGGAEEAIADGDSGYLVEPGDLETMARRVVMLLGDPDRRRAMGERARQGLEPFDIDAMVRRQEALYDELLHRARPAKTTEPTAAG